MLVVRELRESFKALTAWLNDNRHHSYVTHEINTLILQRTLQVDPGYEDANGCNSLHGNGVLKVCWEKENSLSAQCTTSRFENSASVGELYKMSQVLVDKFTENYAKEPELIVLDCDFISQSLWKPAIESISISS